jgi:hypothetical protein
LLFEFFNFLGFVVVNQELMPGRDGELVLAMTRLKLTMYAA